MEMKFSIVSVAMRGKLEARVENVQKYLSAIGGKTDIQQFSARGNSSYRICNAVNFIK